SHLDVNCWFCNQNTVVPYGNRNCWDCPNCEQYNGFQENGDYNKPIPAQHSEHLNHVVSGSSRIPDMIKPQQWVNCQMLLCKKCNNNQTTKIKQLSSFEARDEVGIYDEEIEVYKHHLEQTYKLCRPCQAAVEYYIKHQNRQLRALLLDHHLKRRELNKYNIQSFGSSSSRAPLHVIILRFLAFLSCTFLLSLAVLGSGDLFSSIQETVNSSLAQPPNQSRVTFEHVGDRTFWIKLLDVVPHETFEKLNVAWRYGQTHQIEMVLLGLAACIFAIILAGRVRLRRVDAFASFLWLLVACLYLSERYLVTESFSWLDTVKLGTTTLCCLAGFTSAFATRKAAVQQKPRPRRSEPDSLRSLIFPSSPHFGTATGGSGMSDFLSPLLSVPPGLLQLINQRMHRSKSKEYQYSLPGRLSKVLSLGTIPTFSRTGNGTTKASRGGGNYSCQEKKSKLDMSQNSWHPSLNIWLHTLWEKITEISGFLTINKLLTPLTQNFGPRFLCKLLQVSYLSTGVQWDLDLDSLLATSELSSALLPSISGCFFDICLGSLSCWKTQDLGRKPSFLTLGSTVRPKIL
uniref:Transmembrane protein 201 n=1 Tax=Leptobrachium leishanense TaxID=445787 RepID=A0A8C5N385_9ANUR